MSRSVHDLNREFIGRIHKALYDLDPTSLEKELVSLVCLDALIQLAHPLGNMIGPHALYEQAYAPLQ
jgi:hypothetical protein